MDQSITEQQGVNAVKDYLLNTKKIVPHIVDSNTLPMWDGEIFVYRSTEICNQNFAYRLPVQVKSHQIKDKFPKTLSHQVPIVHLEKYYNDGGVVFFGVCIKNKRRVIYCAFLGRAELKRFLQAGNGEQQSKSVPLSKAPKESNELLKKLKSIDMQRRHELIDLSTLNGRTDFQINFNVSIPKGADPLEYIATHFIDVTISIKGIPGEFYPEAGPVSLQLTSDVDCEISIDNVIYYHSFKRAYRKDGIHIYIGKSCELLLPNEADKHKPMQVSIKPQANDVTEFIHELSFVHSLLTHKCLQTGSNVINFDEINCNAHDIVKLQEGIEYWTKVEKLLTILHIYDTLDITSLSPKDDKNLNVLIRGFVENKPVYSKEHQNDFICCVDISNLKILVLAKHIKNDEFMLLNIHDYCVTGFDDDNNIHHEAPVISYLLSLDYLPSNLNLEQIVDEYERMEHKDSYLPIRANEDSLRILNLYDKTNDSRFLDVAYSLNKWVATKKDLVGTNIVTLNSLQIKIRLNGSLSDSEKAILYSLELNDIQEKFACSVLLKEKDRASRYFSLMDNETQEFYKTLPIYNLYNNLA